MQSKSRPKGQQAARVVDSGSKPVHQDSGIIEDLCLSVFFFFKGFEKLKDNKVVANATEDLSIDIKR